MMIYDGVGAADRKARWGGGGGVGRVRWQG